jgi:hypothetical protein
MPVVLLCASLLLSQAATPAKPSDPREQVATAVAHGVRLLEAKEYARFLQEFVSPLEIKKLLGSEPGAAIDPKVAANFAEDKAEKLLQGLRDAQKATPAFEDDGRTAIYPLRTPIGGRATMVFTKVGKYWYIRN